MLSKVWHGGLAAEDELLGGLAARDAFEILVVLDLAYILKYLFAVCCANAPAYLNDILLGGGCFRR